MAFGIVVDRLLLESPLADAPQVNRNTLLIRKLGTEIVALTLHYRFYCATIVADSAIELYEICLPHTYILCSFALFVYPFPPFPTLDSHYYIPAIELPEDDDRPIGKWGRMHRAYLEETNPLLLNHLILTGKLHSYLADLNKQAQNRCWLIIKQMAAAEGVTEDLKRRSQWEWIKAMNSIVSRTEEIIKSEIINA